MSLNRRQFASAALASIAFTGLARAIGAPPQARGVPGYGPLQPDPRSLLDLPRGFGYSVISQVGEPLDDGFVTPDHFDGMGCFALDRRRVALVRNHELKPGASLRGPAADRPELESRLRAAPFFGSDPAGTVVPGGTSTLVYDLQSGRVDRRYLSLTGTAVNCAGGTTPWGSWLSCEESTLQPPDTSRAHGWVFEVPARQGGLVAPVPLTALGRFVHEAAAVDPRTGIVYLTEDRADSAFYRFLPARPGRLAAGGELQALALREIPMADTRNWKARTIAERRPYAVTWVTLDHVESPDDDLRQRAQAAGAAIFARGEGIHFGSSECFFTCTSGGAAQIGQIMRYRPSRFEGQPQERSEPGTLEVFLESRDSNLFNYGDNLTVAPWGDLIVCEDRADGQLNHLRGVTPDGHIYTFARLRLATELAGVCFSPDGATMFVNAYRPGRTFAIRGPWSRAAA